MTTAEALAVVREAILAKSQSVQAREEQIAALALIEQEVDRRSGLDVSQEVVDQLKARAEKAEAERDNATAALERMRLELVRVDGMVSRYSQSADVVSEDRARWMERYAELEAALREILMTDGLGGASEVMRDIARRALGGGEA